MTDKGKPIEEIIAELETLEIKRAEQQYAEESEVSDVAAGISVEKSQPLSDTPLEHAEGLAVEETAPGAHGNVSPDVKPSDDEYKDVFGESEKDEDLGIQPPDELVLESHLEDKTPYDTGENTDFEHISAGNPGSGAPLEPSEELVLENSFDELILDDEGNSQTLTFESMSDEVAQKEKVFEETDEKPIEEKIFDDIFADKMNGASFENTSEADTARRLSMEALAKEFDELEFTSQAPSDDVAAEISLDNAMDDTFMKVRDDGPFDEVQSSGASHEKSTRQPESESDTASTWDNNDDSWSPEPPLESLAAAGVEDTDTTGEKAGKESGGPPAPPQEKRGSRRMGFLFVLFLVVVAGYAYFVWPTMYRQGQMISGDRTYSMRIHRITQVEEYYEGGKWHRGLGPQVIAHSPQVGKMLPKPADTTRKNPAAAAEKHSEITTQSEVQAPVKAILHKIEKQGDAVSGDAKTVASPEATHDEGVVFADSTKVPGGDVPPATTEAMPAEDSARKPVAPEAAAVPSDAPRNVTESKEVADTISEPAQQEPTDILEAKVDQAPKTTTHVSQKKDRAYAIQIGSMRFLEFANDIVEELDKQGMAPHIKTVKTARDGVWYVVYIGQFDARQKARQYMKDNKIETIYPGSYIRKISLVTAQK